MSNTFAKLLVPAALLAAATTGCRPTREPTSQRPTVSVSSFDDFNKDLAKRVTTVLVPGGSSDFQVVITPAMDPIGTLYRKGRSVPFDDKACVPAAEPMARNMPNVFPSYRLDGKVAAEFGLDETVLQSVASVGVSVAMGTSFTFSVLNPQLKVLSDTAIQGVFTGTTCAAATKKEMVMVRGYVSGQRSFSTQADASANAKVGVVKVGKFNVEGSNAGFLSITDDAPQAFLQILSEVVPPPAQTATAPPSITVPQPVTGPGQIYVQ